MKNKNDHRLKRKVSIRKNVSGTALKPRLSIFRSNAHMFAQLIDDEASKTLVGLSDIKLNTKEAKKLETASLLGKEFAKLAVDKKISEVVFDRSGYKFHGRIKAFADSAREGGLKF
ncbi:MAG: 50S ribosomal protein L18 [bacterium]